MGYGRSWQQARSRILAWGLAVGNVWWELELAWSHLARRELSLDRELTTVLPILW